jgi:hypothetical protein
VNKPAQPATLSRKHRHRPLSISFVSWLVALSVLIAVSGSMAPQLARICGGQGFAGCVGKLSFSTSSGSTTAIPPPACPVMRSDPSFGISLIDTANGKTICERNGEGIAQPASTTKVMAALLVGQYLQTHQLRLDTMVTVQQVDTPVESDAAIANLQVGQAYSVRDLLSMTSILSAADAVMVLARFVAGSRADFLALMNQEAQTLGMPHTHYTSPYGYARTSADNWQDGENTSVGTYSSAADMARLMKAFAQFPDLLTIFGATQYQQGSISLNRAPSLTLPDSWIGLHLPFQVLAVKKGCMWCQSAIHKISYVLLVQFQQQVIAAAFLYTTQNYFNPLIGDMLPTLLWAFHQCNVPAYATYCYPPAPTPTPLPSPTP